MRFKKALHGVGLVTVVFLVGCTMFRPVAYAPAKKSEFQATIPVCKEKISCDAKWNAAKLWVAHHAGYEIQRATDTLIETDYAKSRNLKDTNLSVRVTKEPIEGDIYQLVIEISCANLVKCIPNAQDMALDFNKTVDAAQ